MTDRAMTSKRTAERVPYARAWRTNRLFQLPGVHRQSDLGRRYEDLARAFVAALGGEERLTEAQRTAVRRAAELSALAERLRGEALRGEAVDPLALVRLEGTADRSVRALGITPGKREQQKPGAALAAHLVRNHAAESPA